MQDTWHSHITVRNSYRQTALSKLHFEWRSFGLFTTCTLTPFFRLFGEDAAFFLLNIYPSLFFRGFDWWQFLAQIFSDRHICFSKSFQCLPKPIQSPWRRRQHLHPKLRRKAYYLRHCNLAKTVTGTRHAVQDWECVFTVWSCHICVAGRHKLYEYLHIREVLICMPA